MQGQIYIWAARGWVGGGGETYLMKGLKFYYPRGLLRPKSSLEYMEIGNEIR